MTRQILFAAGLVVVVLFSSSINAQEPGSIAGRVTLQSSHEGIPDVEVVLCPDSGRQAVSVTEGVARLPPRDQLQTIRITAFPGEPKQVTVSSVSPACEDSRRTTTDNAGHFAFSGVAPGSYKVHAQRTGYIGENPRGKPPAVVIQSVTVAAPRAGPDMSISLIKAGTISGTARDSNGKPLVSATALVRSVAAQTQLVATQSDDRGQFRLFGLPPGEFVVSVRPSGPLGEVKLAEPSGKPVPPQRPPYTDYPKTIVLREGEEVMGVDVVVQTQP